MRVKQADEVMTLIVLDDLQCGLSMRFLVHLDAVLQQGLSGG